MNRRFAPWALSVGIVSCVCLLIDVTAQRSIRSAANDPQIQIAEDAGAAFTNNQFTDETLKSSFETFVPSMMQVNIGVSLSPWIQVYNESGEVLESSAVISNAESTPRVPKQIFETVSKHGEDRVTWQPEKGIRQAIVVTKFTGLRSGYIVVGRSLKEIELRIGNVSKMIVGGWVMLMCLIGGTAAWTFGYFTKFTQIKTPRV